MLSPALEFDPDRFIDERLHKYLTPNPYIFLPFNAGPRICVGQQVLSLPPFDKRLSSVLVCLQRVLVLFDSSPSALRLV